MVVLRSRRELLYQKGKLGPALTLSRHRSPHPPPAAAAAAAGSGYSLFVLTTTPIGVYSQQMTSVFTDGLHTKGHEHTRTGN